MLLRITGQHKTRNVVKRTVHWNRMEPNRLRTEPTRTVLRFLSDFANLHEPKRTAGSLGVEQAPKRMENQNRWGNIRIEWGSIISLYFG